jgi:hypothetical protein
MGEMGKQIFNNPALKHVEVIADHASRVEPGEI